jgi:RNA polymerase sigma-70 factor (ECF subfamily)
LGRHDCNPSTKACTAEDGRGADFKKATILLKRRVDDWCYDPRPTGSSFRVGLSRGHASRVSRYERIFFAADALFIPEAGIWQGESVAITLIRSTPDEDANRRNDGEDADVRRAQSDPQAFAILYRRHFDDVYRYCFYRLNNSETAADATSQVFTQALAALPRYRGGTFRGWLFTIARNVTIDAIRRQRPQSTLDAASDLCDQSPSPEDHAMARETASTLVRLLAQLPPNQRSVVELRLSGLSGQEVADVLNLSLNAVKALQFRAYSRLRSLLADDERSRYSEAFNAQG